MRQRTTWIAWALVATLAACGKTDDQAAPQPSAQAPAAGGAPAVAPADDAPRTPRPPPAPGDVRMEVGNARLSEADLGLPLYPGARPVDGGSSLISSGDVSTASITLHSADSADKVAAYYRAQLKARAAGKQLTDAVGGDGSANLALIDTRDKSSVEVSIGQAADAGSSIQIVSNWRGAAR